MHKGEIKVILDELDFPSEFDFLRTRRFAKFPILDEKTDNIWIESVRATLINISSDGTYNMTSIEHSGSQVFDFESDLRLEPTTFESIYKVPGLKWILAECV